MFISEDQIMIMILEKSNFTELPYTRVDEGYGMLQKRQ